MSQQKDGDLRMSQSFNFNREATDQYRGKSIQADNFYSWHKDNMYKSSYSKFHSPASIQPRNSAIPGYAGFIPGLRSENIHAKGYTPVTKQSFSSDKLAKNLLGLSTTGFNLNKTAFIDPSKTGQSHKYGKSSLQRPHPNWNSAKWQTTTQQFYKRPLDQVNPTYRQTGKFLQSKKYTTQSSGFGTNHAPHDGKGWMPDPILRGDNHRTEYRDLFNKPKDFHRSTFVDKERKLRATQLNYKYT